MLVVALRENHMMTPKTVNATRHEFVRKLSIPTFSNTGSAAGSISARSGGGRIEELIPNMCVKKVVARWNGRVIKAGGATCRKKKFVKFFTNSLSAGRKHAKQIIFIWKFCLSIFLIRF
jgi:hypothetical protein